MLRTMIAQGHFGTPKFAFCTIIAVNLNADTCHSCATFSFPRSPKIRSRMEIK